MTLTNEQIQQIHTIWENYKLAKVTGLRPDELPDIDEKRRNSIVDIKAILTDFFNETIDVHTFKSILDGYNKRNNYWGFPAVKGQMFFNQLLRSYEGNIDRFTVLLKELIKEPQDLSEALDKISRLEQPLNEQFQKAKDKRKVAHPGSSGYFLSYFWQIYNPEKWPIIYTSLIRAFESLGLWQKRATQREDYEAFFELNKEIRSILSNYSKGPVSNWDAEHAFWNFNGNPNTQATRKATTEDISTASEPLAIIEVPDEPVLTASFDLYDYVIPKLSKLIDVGKESDKPSSVKGLEFERLVAEAFKQLGFETEVLGQGKGRNPDALLRYREEHTAFIVDAKAYSNGYVMGTDDRAILEYINHYCPMLQRDGCRKIGFIIVSNSFKSDFDGFIDSITWNTDIKRFILLTTEALLYLVAYRTKDSLSLNSIIDRLITCGNLIDAKNIIEEFDDV